MYISSVADPGFPIGGRAPVRGGMDLRRGHFSVKMYAKTKELGPIGGRAPGTPSLDPPMYHDAGFNCNAYQLNGTFVINTNMVRCDSKEYDASVVNETDSGYNTNHDKFYGMF